MARGITPRRPSRSGRHEAARGATQGSRNESLREKPFPSWAKKSGIPKARAAKKKAGDSDNSTAPERVTEIHKRLYTTYQVVTCAMQHMTAWVLLLVKRLSAQIIDVWYKH